MQWQLELGPVAQDISTQATNMGQPIPAAITDKPELHAGNVLFYRAFWHLDSERAIGMGIGCIPWRAMHYYSQVYEFDHAQWLALEYLIPLLDNCYVAYVNKPKGGD